MSDIAVAYDPYSADIRENPYPVYQYLRDAAPIYRNPDKGFFVLSRFADVLGVLHDWETYSSAKGITLEGLPPDEQQRAYYWLAGWPAWTGPTIAS